VLESVRNPRIDGLRGFLAIYVLFFDCMNLERGGSAFERTLEAYLFCIVPAFFILSGYLLQQSYAQRMSDYRRPKLSFYVSRFFRIWPLWFVVLLYYFFRRQTPLGIWLVNLSFLFGFFPWNDQYLVVGPAWSLFVEECYYAVFPWIQRALRTPWSLVAFVLLYVFSIWVEGNWLLLGLPAFKKIPAWLPIRNFHYFLIGYFLFEATERNFSESNYFDRFLNSEILGAISGTDLVFFGVVAGCIANVKMPIEFMAISLTLTAFARKGVLTYLFETRFMRWFGVRCYAFYILQEIAFMELGLPLGKLPVSKNTFEWVVFAVAFVLLTVASAASYRWLERPAMLLGRRLVERVNGVPPATV
jgi:peptidoglycan/LPS O-acetylase OafA/YrhL